MTTQEPEIERPDMTSDDEEVAGTVPAPTTPQEKRSLSSALLGSLLYLAFFTGMTLFNYFVDKHPEKLAFLPPAIWAIITPVTTIAYLLLLVYTIRQICRLSLTARRETLVMVLALLVFIVINPMATEVIWGLLNGKPIHEVWALISSGAIMPAFIKTASPQLQLAYRFAIEITVPFFLILIGVYFGQLLARIIHEAEMLVPVSIIAGLIDFWGVYWGPVGTWSEQAPAVVNIATATTAATATPAHIVEQMPQQLRIFSSISPPQSIGIGDFVFLAFFLACAYRLGFSARRTMWGIFYGLLASVLVMALDGTTFFGHPISIEYLPGLVFICGGALLANLRSWRLSRQERVMTGALTAILLAVIGTTVVRAEWNKPRVHPISFTVTATAKRAMVTAALKRSLTGKLAGNDLIVLDGEFLYIRTGVKPELAGWGMLAIARSENPSVRNTRQIILSSKPDTKDSAAWEVVGRVQSPPDVAYRYLPQQKGDDKLSLLKNARGVPPAALALIDEVETTPLTGNTKEVLLLMTPAKIQLRDGRTGNILKAYDVKRYTGAQPSVVR